MPLPDGDGPEVIVLEDDPEVMILEDDSSSTCCSEDSSTDVVDDEDHRLRGEESRHPPFSHTVKKDDVRGDGRTVVVDLCESSTDDEVDRCDTLDEDLSSDDVVFVREVWCCEDSSSPPPLHAEQSWAYVEDAFDDESSDGFDGNVVSPFPAFRMRYFPLLARTWDTRSGAGGSLGGETRGKSHKRQSPTAIKGKRRAPAKRTRRGGSKATRRGGSKATRRGGSKATRRGGSKATRRGGSKATRRGGSKATRRGGSKATRRGGSYRGARRGGGGGGGGGLLARHHHNQAHRPVDGSLVGGDALPISRENAGRRMLEKMGWKGEGLGVRGDGILEPVAHRIKMNKHGLGFV